MTWEQKFLALKALSIDAHLTTTLDNDWCCSVPGVEEADGDTLAGVSGFGKTVEQAVEAVWTRVERQAANKRFVLHAMGPNRRAFKWSGFMWREVSEN